MHPEQLLNFDQIAEFVFELAQAAAAENEVPVGSLLCKLNDPLPDGALAERLTSFLDGAPLSMRIIASGQNRIISRRDPTSHAEIEAIRNGCAAEGSERLGNTLLFTMLEPCLMCSGAITLARIDAVIFFAPTLSGIGLCDLLQQRNGFVRRLNHYPLAIHALSRQERAAALLRDFFRKKR